MSDYTAVYHLNAKTSLASSITASLVEEVMTIAYILGHADIFFKKIVIKALSMPKYLFVTQVIMTRFYLLHCNLIFLV